VAKEEENFIDMVSKAINAKATNFDMSAATADLAAPLSASGLVDHPETPCVDTDALDVVAHACGADKDDTEDVSDEEVHALQVPMIIQPTSNPSLAAACRDV
jgi:hypothetical protein